MIRFVHIRKAFRGRTIRDMHVIAVGWDSGSSRTPQPKMLCKSGEVEEITTSTDQFAEKVILE